MWVDSHSDSKTALYLLYSENFGKPNHHNAHFKSPLCLYSLCDQPPSPGGSSQSA